MIRPHPRPDCHPDCFGCKVRTLAIGGDSIWRKSERTNAADIAAYNRMGTAERPITGVTGSARAEWG